MARRRKRITEKEAFAVCQKCPHVQEKDNSWFCTYDCEKCKFFKGVSLRVKLKALRVAIISCPAGFWP